MSTQDEIPTVVIGDYVRVIIQRWRVVLAATLIGVVLGAGYLLATPAEATATTVVNIAPITADPYNASRSSASLLDMQTEVQAASSVSVANRAAELLGDGSDAAEVRSALTVTTIDSTTVLRISVAAETAGRARAGADAVAQAFLEYRSAQASNQISKVLSENATRLETLRDQLSEANKRLADATVGSSAASEAEADKQLLTSQINSVIERSSALEGVDTSGGAVLTTAASNAVTFAPDPVTILAGGLLAGGTIGLVGAFIRQARDRRVHSVADVDIAGTGPVLARLEGDHLHYEDNASTLAVARELLLNSSALRSGSGVVALIEASDSRPAIEVFSEFAWAFAEGGVNVSVVCIPTANQYESYLAQHLHLGHLDPNGVTVLANTDAVKVWAAKDRMAWIPGTREHIAALRETSVVLLVCPGSASDGDRMAATRMADGVVLYAVEQLTPRRNLTAVAKIAESLDRPVLGTIVGSEYLVPADRFGGLTRREPVARHAASWPPISQLRAGTGLDDRRHASLQPDDTTGFVGGGFDGQASVEERDVATPATGCRTIPVEKKDGANKTPGRGEASKPSEQLDKQLNPADNAAHHRTA